MKRIVVDTNIVISTLLSSDGVIGTFLLKELHDIEKLSCYYLYIELFDKKEKILKISGYEERDLLELLYLVIKRITFINENQISEDNWKKAIELTEGIDVKDVSFVALSLQMDAALWTGDKRLYKGLKNKGFENVVNMDDLRRILNR